MTVAVIRVAVNLQETSRSPLKLISRTECAHFMCFIEEESCWLYHLSVRSNGIAPSSNLKQIFMSSLYFSYSVVKTKWVFLIYRTNFRKMIFLEMGQLRCYSFSAQLINKNKIVTTNIKISLNIGYLT